MSPLRDEDLIRDPAIRWAVEARRAAESSQIRSRRWPSRWLISAVVIGVLVIVLVGLLRLAG